MNVLIVDDSKSLRQILGDMLRSMGHEVLEAEHGQDALERLDGQGIKLVITDLNMPVMDGLELLTELRKKPENDAMRIIMATTEHQPSLVIKALMRGADEFLAKPVSAEVLQQKMKQIGLG